MFFTLSLLAQEGSDSTDTKKLYKIVKQDGYEYIGEILQDDGREVLLLTENLGKIYIPKSEIVSITLIENPGKIKFGNFREAGPFTTRYYFTNNALPIQRGEDYAMIHLYGPEVHFALSDRFSLGIMATWIASPIGLAAKYSIPTKNERLNFSLGTIMLSSGYLFKAEGWGGLHWANMTLGDPGKNLTLSAGYGYIDLGFGTQHYYETDADKLKKGPVISIAGLTPVGRKASFIFDSMIAFTQTRVYKTVYDYPNPDIVLFEDGNKVSALLMPAMRFQNKENMAFQVSLSGVIEYSDVGFRFGDSATSRSFPMPMCSWLFKF